MGKEALIIRTAKLEQMPFFLSLAEKEGWNPGLYDDLPFFSLDPNGFFIGEVQQEKIGCISAVRYGNSLGFIGFYIVRPEFRGQGYGIQLWQKALEYLADVPIGLEGVIAQQENYKKSGFKLFYRNLRFEFVGHTQEPSHLTNLKNVPFKTLLEFDSLIFGCNRERFLEKWIAMPNAHGYAVMEKKQLVGYGLIRECKKAWKIGPLFANDGEIAYLLYRGLVSKVSGKPVLLDVPEVNAQAVALAEKLNMRKVFETARMYNKTPPAQKIEKIFGITTFEMG